MQYPFVICGLSIPQRRFEPDLLSCLYGAVI